MGSRHQFTGCGPRGGVRVSWVGVQNATSYRVLWKKTDGEILLVVLK